MAMHLASDGEGSVPRMVRLVESEPVSQNGARGSLREHAEVEVSGPSRNAGRDSPGAPLVQLEERYGVPANGLLGEHTPGRDGGHLDVPSSRSMLAPSLRRRSSILS